MTAAFLAGVVGSLADAGAAGRGAVRQREAACLSGCGRRVGDEECQTCADWSSPWLPAIVGAVAADRPDRARRPWRSGAGSASARGRHAAGRALSRSKRRCCAGRCRLVKSATPPSTASACTGTSSSRPPSPGAIAIRAIRSSGAGSPEPPPTHESAEWLAAKFKAAGLSDVRIQPLDLEPQWMPQTWEVVGHRRRQDDPRRIGPAALRRGRPARRRHRRRGGLRRAWAARPTSPARTCAARPCSCSTRLGLRNEGAVRRADAKGAAVIFEVDMLPGNMRYQAYPSGTKAPAFELGGDDGYAVRETDCGLAGRAERHASRRRSTCRGCRTSRRRWCGAPSRGRPTRPSTSSPTATAGSTQRATTPAAWRRSSAWRSSTRNSRRRSGDGRWCSSDWTATTTRDPAQASAGAGCGTTGRRCSRRRR